MGIMPRLSVEEPNATAAASEHLVGDAREGRAANVNQLGGDCCPHPCPSPKGRNILSPPKIAWAIAAVLSHIVS